ncbi:hypothetical protein Tco_0157867 [Tanacetum coccineum]
MTGLPLSSALKATSALLFIVCTVVAVVLVVIVVVVAVVVVVVVVVGNCRSAPTILGQMANPLAITAIVVGTRTFMIVIHLDQEVWTPAYGFLSYALRCIIWGNPFPDILLRKSWVSLAGIILEHIKVVAEVVDYRATTSCTLDL